MTKIATLITENKELILLQREFVASISTNFLALEPGLKPASAVDSSVVKLTEILEKMNTPCSSSSDPQVLLH